MCHDDCPQPVRGGDALTESEVSISLVSGHLPAFLALPGSRPAPAVLLLHDINGPNAFYHDVSRRLAMAGYTTLLPDLFHRHAPLTEDTREARFARMQATEQLQVLGDIESALHWLRKHEHTTGAVATIGFCMGGTLALLGASRYPAPAATIAWYGFPNRERTPVAPILPLDTDQVSSLESPLLAFWGTADSGVGMDNVAAYDARLTEYGKPHEFVTYDDIPHGFLTFDETSPNYSAAADSWSRALTFLETHLTPETAS
jgi:carboxymethylenebutenolidase